MEGREGAEFHVQQCPLIRETLVSIRLQHLLLHPGNDTCTVCVHQISCQLVQLYMKNKGACQLVNVYIFMCAKHKINCTT